MTLVKSYRHSFSGYLPRKNIIDITVFWDQKPWLEAVESCSDLGMSMFYGWMFDPYHNFILAQALQQNRYSQI